ncbi:hypothetical protein ANMWB30_23890 [Arthrobacter sp. MWB30]|nr:hypothetical protein ANMWB30_23890 [Arthrobacter sp. MWB30]
MTDIRALLVPIKERRAAVGHLPGQLVTLQEPFHPETFGIEGMERWREHTNTVNFGEDRATAVFVLHAPTDLDRLAKAVEAVLDLCDNMDDDVVTQADGIHVPVYLIRETLAGALTPAPKAISETTQDDHVAG